ncbi:MAG: hypothetical protein H0U75_05150 [Legionella sp.]|nr:hypothetical protein [Legionella sp.]
MLMAIFSIPIALPSTLPLASPLLKDWEEGARKADEVLYACSSCNKG